jgi:hypothetical protein
MKAEIKKFLEFNGKVIYFLAIDGQYWIALKPICEALNVDYLSQYKNLKEDKILSLLLSEQTMVAADGKQRKMICLPEYFIYGYIFSIHSSSEELQSYKLECYRILYEHFHGAITGRKELLSQKARLQVEIDKCFNTLDPDVALQLQRSNTALNQVNARLRKLDIEVIEEERDLFNT